jgi:hypothetical protein
MSPKSPSESHFLVSAIRSLWKHLGAAFFGAFGLFLVFVWVMFPVPGRRNLTEVEGSLSAYSIETDRSWFAHDVARRPHTYVLFKVEGVDGRFWNDAVGPGNVRAVFPHLGVRIRFYRISHYPYLRINGNGEKTYGLDVDGLEVQSVDSAFGYDSFLVVGVAPILGIVVLIFAILAWRKKDRDERSSSVAQRQ